MSVPLDLDQLQSFCAIADCGSFTEAARRVNKTQSAVSMQIKRLEERLGHILLARDGRTVSLTHHGEVLYERARKMLRTNAEILDHFSEGAQEIGGALNDMKLLGFENRGWTEGIILHGPGTLGQGLGALGILLGHEKLLHQLLARIRPLGLVLDARQQ